MSVWRRGALTDNPYVRNAFRVARLERSVLRRVSVAQRIGEARSIVEHDPSAHSIRGKQVTQQEINAAESILMSGQTRILEELLVHEAERPALGRVRQLAARCASLMAQPPAGKQEPDLSFLSAALCKFVRRYLSAAEAAEPEFGALELDLAPPFGRPGEEE